ncbi:MAG: stage V sporulation protein AD, partial [Clostridia bacterium]|nr:stage V sporulation protein AD [Clostridia bacterium]
MRDTFVKTLLEIAKKDKNVYIVTGDLGKVDSEILYDLFRSDGLDISAKHNDCGLMIFSPEQDTHAGGSG